MNPQPDANLPALVDQTEVCLPVETTPGSNTLNIGAGHSLFWASFDHTTPEGIILAMACRGEPTYKAEDHLGQMWEVKHLFSHWAHMTDTQTGEVVKLQRVILISPDGRTMSTCASGAIDGLQFLCSLFGPPPWEPAIPIVIRPIKTRAGRTTYGITVDPSFCKLSTSKEAQRKAAKK